MYPPKSEQFKIVSFVFLVLFNVGFNVFSLDHLQPSHFIALERERPKTGGVTKTIVYFVGRKPSNHAVKVNFEHETIGLGLLLGQVPSWVSLGVDAPYHVGLIFVELDWALKNRINELFVLLGWLAMVFRWCVA